MRESAGSGMSHRQFMSMAAATAASASLAATQQPRRTGGTFISAKTTEAPSLDPIFGQALSRHRSDPLFYSRLVEWGADGKLEPSLAESWTMSPDGKSWTFKLRQGVKFHNGREFVADDVKYTYERALHPKIGSGGRGYLTAIDGIEVPDKYTVRLHMLQPSASLLAGLAGNWSSIVPHEEIEKRGDLRRAAVGTGPLLLQEWVSQGHIKARQNPDYFEKGKPYVDALEIKVIPDEGNIHRPAPHRQRSPRAAGRSVELRTALRAGVRIRRRTRAALIGRERA
jgi:ABC-type transport system substrate-binding protein